MSPTQVFKGVLEEAQEVLVGLDDMPEQIELDNSLRSVKRQQLASGINNVSVVQHSLPLMPFLGFVSGDPRAGVFQNIGATASCKKNLVAVSMENASKNAATHARED